MRPCLLEVRFLLSQGQVLMSELALSRRPRPQAIRLYLSPRYFVIQSKPSAQEVLLFIGVVEQIPGFEGSRQGVPTVVPCGGGGTASLRMNMFTNGVLCEADSRRRCDRH